MTPKHIAFADEFNKICVCSTYTNINVIGLLNVTGSKYWRKLSAMYLKIPVVLAGG